jgi:hypothetical protein
MGFFDMLFSTAGEYVQHAPSKDCWGVDGDGDPWLSPISQSMDGTVVTYKCTAPGCRKTHKVSDRHGAGSSRMPYADER